MARGSLRRELDVIFESGTKLARQFGEEREARQEELDSGKERDGKAGDSSPVAGSLPKSLDFEMSYQCWYTCALPLIREAAPDRYEEFQRFYCLPEWQNPRRPYVLHDYFTHATPAPQTWPWLGAFNSFLSQLCIVKAASSRLEWQATSESMDHSLRDVHIAELEAARALIPSNELAAAAIAGTILQRFLQALAKKHKLRFRKLSPPSREVANSLREAKVLDDDVWHQCTWLAGIHERCSGETEDPPSKLQVRDLVDSTHWLITNVF